jgi:FtsH-binding integral membrane protein
LPRSGLIAFEILAIGGFTIFDFNRLRRASPDGAVVIAAIFFDIVNVFLLLLELFGGQRD